MNTPLQSTEPGTGHPAPVQPKPEWAKQSTTPCRYYSEGDEGDGDFWYDTKEDFRNGLSYSDDPDSMVSPDFQNKTYSLPPYGEFRTTVIDGNAWCSLVDVGKIAGIETSKITGYVPDNSVRGEPGYLIPDGIRYLYLQGIIGKGVRLEAIIPKLMKARDGKRFSEWLLNTVIPDIYADFPAMADAARELVASTEALVSDLLESSARSTRVDEFRFYDECYGEFRAVIIGTRLWFRVDDIAAYHSVPPEVIFLLLGNDRVIDIGKMGDHDSSHATGLETQYVEFGIFQMLLKLSHHGASLIDWFTPYLSRVVKNIAAHDGVSAGALHRMLGHHQTFDSWAWEIDRKNGYALTSVDPDHHSNPHQDLRVPIKLALKIALKEQTFAAAITYCLLTDGGYLHGGPWNESPEACLKRFDKLIPDRQGRVDCGKMKEFMEPRGSTSNRFDTDEASETLLMTSEDAWELIACTSGTTTNSLKKFGVQRITKVFS